MNVGRFEHIEVESGPVAQLRLNRPEVRNAFNDALIEEVIRAVTMLNSEATRVIVLSGLGKSFSAGADLNWMRSMIDYSRAENIADAQRMAAMFRALNESAAIVIGRIHGAAMGGGAGLASVCDIAVAAHDTLFAFSEVRLGIIPAVISPFVLNRIGVHHARRYFVTGERFDGRRAATIGLVSESVEADELDSRVEQLAQEVLEGGPEACRAAKALIPGVLAAHDPIAFTAEQIADRRASSEGQEGMRAFLERQPAPWRAGSS